MLKVEACSCDTISFDDALVYADEIFLGELIKIEKVKAGTFEYEDGESIQMWEARYYFEVIEKWKGRSNRIMILYEERGSCEFSFRMMDKKYLVYASYGIEMHDPEENNSYYDNKLTTWLCTRTTPDRSYYDNPGWFQSDIEKLNGMFPNKVKTINYNTINYWMLFITLTILLLDMLYVSRFQA